MTIFENKVLGLIFNKPMAKFHIRQLSRDTNLDTKTIMKYLKKWEKEGIMIKKNKKTIFPIMNQIDSQENIDLKKVIL